MAGPAYLAACGIDGSFAAVGLGGDGRPLWQRGLRARAHDIVADAARGVCVVMGRKPGAYAEICDLASGAVRVECRPAAGYHFDGHAVFSADGRALFATQSADGTQAGSIAVYDAAAGTLLHRFTSAGTEPHELVWAAPGILVVAHGGIVNRYAPDGIDSSLVLLDAATGEVGRRWVLDDELETLSIRHLAVLPRGRIVFAMQDQDAATDRRPLVGIADVNGDLAFLPIPAALQMKLDGYIGSVAVAAAGGIVAATAPRGGMALFWSADDGRFLGHVALSDVCGLAAGPDPRGFRLTTGHGRLADVSADGVSGALALDDLQTDPAVQWDNHLARVGG